MNKSMLIGTVIGVALATAGGVIAGYSYMGVVSTGDAEVIQVKEVRETVNSPRQVCQDVQVTHQQPVQDEHRVLGTVAGAVIGGVLGNQVGGGSGKKVATVAGAAAGGYAGNKTQENMQAGDTYVTTETRCETVTDSREEIRGFDVTYRLEGKEGHVRMDHHPGKSISVVDGQLVLDAG